MKKLTYLVLFTIINIYSLVGQNIYSALHHDEKLKFNGDRNIKKIIKQVTFLNKSGKEIEKSTIIFNDSSRVVQEDRFNERYKRQTRFIINYDSTQTHSIKRKVQLRQPYVRKSTTTFYKYDENNFLIKIIDKKYNKVFRITNIINNKNGHPIELEVIENSILYGKEKAEYDYENNIMKRTVYSPSGEILSSTSGRIDFSISDKRDLRNEYGDLIQSKLFKFEYKYDKYGNWKRKKRYMLKNGKWTENALFKRTITYGKKTTANKT